MREKVINDEWQVSKILVTNPYSTNMLFYLLPRYNLYIESIKPVKTVGAHGAQPPFEFGEENNPHLVNLRTRNPRDVSRFIQCEREFRAFKIFKHGTFPDKETANKSFLGNTVINLLHLCQGDIIRIKSSDDELRDMFYDFAVTFNMIEGTNCSFDYECYDYTLELRTYEKEDGKIIVFAILFGLNMPNSWKMR